MHEHLATGKKVRVWLPVRGDVRMTGSRCPGCGAVLDVPPGTPTYGADHGLCRTVPL